jgi:hypothetical protein
MSRIDDIWIAGPRPSATPAAAMTRTLTNYHVFSLAAALFLLPNALFALMALQPLPATAVLAGCAGVGVLLAQWRPTGPCLSAPIDLAQMGLCLAAGLALCLLGGEGHLFYANTDWLIRDAVLADLARGDATPVYLYDGQGYYLRAPLGMYMLPAMIGRVFGLFAAHVAQLCANAVPFGTMLYLACRMAGARSALFLVILLGFGGLDLLGDLAARAASLQSEPMNGETLEWWSDPFIPGAALQYSGMITQIFWVPNHAAPGWFVAILVLLRSRKEISLALFIACCAPLVLWSPFAPVGALSFGLALAMRSSWREIISVPSLSSIAAGLCFLPIAFYLVTGSHAIAHGAQVSRDGFASIYFVFLLIEIPQAAVLLYTWRKIEAVDRATLVVALLTLCLLPLYAFGPSNDLAMRASIPALFLLAFNFARVASSTPRDNSALPTIIAVIVLISAETAIMQIKHALAAGDFAISDCNLLTSWQSTSPMGFPVNYLAAEDSLPRWLLRRKEAPAPLRLEYRDCWPDHPGRDILRRDGV